MSDSEHWKKASEQFANCRESENLSQCIEQDIVIKRYYKLLGTYLHYFLFGNCMKCQMYEKKTQKVTLSKKLKKILSSVFRLTSGICKVIILCKFAVTAFILTW